MVRHPIVALCAALVALPGTALADNPPSDFNYYTPPKLLKQGTSTTPIAGPGTVIVKVLVNKDGTFKVQGIVKSTNPGDEKAALEIAATSKYKPATRGKNKETAFYDFSLKFSGSGAEAQGDTPELAQYVRMMNAGNYSGAQADLKTYIAAHPNDEKAHLYLGVSSTYLNQPDEAIAAFEKAGEVPAEYRVTEAKAYADGAVAAIQAKAFDKAIGYAKHAVSLSPTYANYDALGFAEISSGDAAAATTDFDKARELAKTANAPAKQRALIASNLITSYLQQGDLAKAKEMAAEAKQLDPSASTDPYFENYYFKRGGELRAAGKAADAAALFEKAALDVPSAAASFYAQAALAYLQIKPNPEDVKASADADKALAIDANSALANFAKGVALADQNKKKDALDYLNKADELSKKGSDPGLTASIENVIKQLNGGK